MAAMARVDLLGHVLASTGTNYNYLSYDVTPPASLLPFPPRPTQSQERIAAILYEALDSRLALSGTRETWHAKPRRQDVDDFG